MQGTVYDDGLPAGGALTVEWTKVSGPGTVVFVDPASLTTGVTFGSVGVYALRITATDTELTATDTITVRVEAPDLDVESLDVTAVTYDGQTLSVGGTASASIINHGSTAAAFTVAFFEDHNGNGTFEPADDNLLGAAPLGSLAAGATAVASAPLSGVVLFPGNIIHVVADSDAVVTESDETNNYASSAPPCVPQPPSTSPFAPVIEWSRSTFTVLPDYKQVETSPAVADLDGDGIPEIVVVTYSSAAGGPAVLRALNGRTGDVVFTVTDPTRRVFWASNLAIGDIDGDGHPEIVAVAASTTQLLAFEHDGTLKWRARPRRSRFRWPRAGRPRRDGTRRSSSAARS